MRRALPLTLARRWAPLRVRRRAVLVVLRLGRLALVRRHVLVTRSGERVSIAECGHG